MLYFRNCRPVVPGYIHNSRGFASYVLKQAPCVDSVISVQRGWFQPIHRRVYYIGLFAGQYAGFLYTYIPAIGAITICKRLRGVQKLFFCPVYFRNGWVYSGIVGVIGLTAYRRVHIESSAVQILAAFVQELTNSFCDHFLFSAISYFLFHRFLHCYLITVNLQVELFLIRHQRPFV